MAAKWGACCQALQCNGGAGLLWVLVLAMDLIEKDWKFMIACYLRYVVDASKLKEFEHYGKLWIPLVEKFGGQHLGYFLPSEGANNIALAIFTFPSLARYEEYRSLSMADPECQAAFRYAEETKCIVSYERSFFRPVFG